MFYNVRGSVCQLPEIMDHHGPCLKYCSGSTVLYLLFGFVFFVAAYHKPKSIGRKQLITVGASQETFRLLGAQKPRDHFLEAVAQDADRFCVLPKQKDAPS